MAFLPAGKHEVPYVQTAFDLLFIPNPGQTHLIFEVACRAGLQDESC